jgi:hypothetical protein
MHIDVGTAGGLYIYTPAQSLPRVIVPARVHLYLLPDLETGLRAGVTGQQGMFTPLGHLIPSLVYLGISVNQIL